MKPELIQKILDSIQSTLKGVVIATGLLYVCIIGAGIYIYVESSHSNKAICALKSDLETRTASAKEFLKTHPNGIPDVPVGVLKEQIRNQERSIKALSVASC